MMAQIIGLKSRLLKIVFLIVMSKSMISQSSDFPLFV